MQGDDVWQGSWQIPAGSYQYKAALNDSWAENYGLNAVQDGANIPLNLAADTTVNFYYDHKSHWVTDNIGTIIATVPGSFQQRTRMSRRLAAGLPALLAAGPGWRWHLLF